MATTPKTETTDEMMARNSGVRGSTVDQTAERKDGPRIPTIDQRQATNARAADQHARRGTARRR
jgi:hypothetical protein